MIILSGAGTVSGVTDVTDDFNRADSAVSLGTSTSGHAWTADLGTWGISSNTAYCPTLSGGTGRATVNYGARDCTLEVTISTVQRPFGLVMGYAGDPLTQIQVRCFIIIGIHRTQFILLRNGESSLNLLTVDGEVWADGDVLGAELAGSTFKLFRNGVQIGTTVNDSRINDIVGTNHGLRAEITTVRFDNFSITP